MTVHTRLSISGPLLFEATFDEAPSATMRFESHHVELPGADGLDEGHTHVFFYWLSGCSVDAFRAAHERDDDVADLTAVSADGDGFFRTRTRPLPHERRPVVQRIVEQGMAVKSGRRTSDGLSLSLLGPSRHILDDLFRGLQEVGFDVRVGRLTVGEAGSSGSTLTAAQRETLKLAYERGYYRIPRGTSLMDLAAELDVSDQACSERLRRGIQRLLAEEFD